MLWFSRLIAVIFLVGGIAGAAWSARSVWEQWRLNDTATQVQGIVTRSEASSPRYRTSGHVSVSFTYEYNGVRHESERIFAANARMWLAGPRYQVISATFPAGSTPAVWVRDDAPEKGFLIKEYRAEPYVYFFWAVLMVGAASGALVLYRRPKPMRLVRGATPALWELPSTVSVDMRWRKNVVIGGVLLAATLVVSVHGVMTVQWDRMWWIFALSGLCALYLAGHSLVSGVLLWYSRDAARMRVMVDRERARRGEPLRVVVERRVSQSGGVEGVDVSLACARAVGKKYVTMWSETRTVMDAERIARAQGDVVRAKATIVVAPNMPATGVDDEMGDVVWTVQVFTRAKGPDPSESWEIVVV